MAKPSSRGALPASPVDWIIIKRDGGSLHPSAIEALIAGFMRGQVTDYQMSAWLMATYFSGMSARETVALTSAMLRSGRQLAHAGSRRMVDKHSTGGVGDKISLCLAPLVAACGAGVPMISGRGLGHTGGTLDKLEAIPGYQTRLAIPKFKAIVQKTGASIIGQTDDLAPADRRIYALRDVTGTVPSIPLIVASILSKKLAAGLDALVMDVKVGSGAFMRDLDSARSLGRALRGVGRRLGLPVRGLLTDMSAPIGLSIGNALEVREAIDVLAGAGPEDTRELTLALGVEMLLAAELAASRGEARGALERALSSGAAAECFARMVRLHGGDARVVEQPARLPRARARVPIPSPRAGVVAGIEARALGELSVAIGAGRTRADQAVDPSVGIELCVQRGARVGRGEPLGFLHLASARGAAASVAAARRAFLISASAPAPTPRVLGRL